MPADAKRLYVDQLGMEVKIRRAIWIACRVLLFSKTPDVMFNKWRIFLLKWFGARIGAGCRIAPSCKVWAPWNLEMGDYCCLAAGVDCYNVSPVRLGSYITVSQRSYVCTASHDIGELALPLIHNPIEIGDYAWVCAEAFLGPGIKIATGAVVAARAVATRDVESWTVVAGNPARPIKKREIKQKPQMLVALEATDRLEG